MSKYVFIYHGGNMPESAEEGAKVMADWQAWLGGLGNAVIEGGNPVGRSSPVHSSGSGTGAGRSTPTNVYSLIDAADLEQALALAKNCPILKADGSVEIAEAMEM